MVLAEDLRQSVLQAALQGKLTARLETDSDVNEMLISIQAEKIRRNADKKIKKEKVLPEIQKEDIPFDIPHHWRWVRLSEIGEIIGGGTPKTSQEEFWENGTIAWVTPADMNGCGKYIEKGEKCITRSGLDSSSAKMFPAGSVIISSRAPIGYIAISKNEASTSQGCKTFSAYMQSLVLSEFVYYVMRFRVPDMEKRATGTTFKEISGKGVGETVIPLPPTEEQQRIVDKINEIMPEIDEYERIEKELEELKNNFPKNMKDALLQAAMQGRLTERMRIDSSVDELLIQIEEDRKDKINCGIVKKDKRLFINYIENEEQSYIIPDTWRMVTLGSIVYKLTDGTHKTPEYAVDGVKFVSVKDISSGRLDLSGTKFIKQTEHDELYKRCNPEKGDMLLSKIGTTGVPAIVDTEEPFSLFVSVALLKYNHQYIHEKFLYYLLMCPLVQEQVKENTRGIGNKNWVLDFIAKTVIVLPPIEEQQRIADRLDVLLPLCDDLNRLICHQESMLKKS